MRGLAEALDTRYAFVARFDDVDRAIMPLCPIAQTTHRRHPPTPNVAALPEKRMHSVAKR